MTTEGAVSEFSSPTQSWFLNTFGSSTGCQEQAWPAIATGAHVLLCAPTGSGKTLAAFLSALDRLGSRDASVAAAAGTTVLYISPLRALAVDVDKNLKAPLRGITLAAERLGSVWVAPSVGVRTGDTDAKERRRLAKHPPDILITTPESLYLMLTSAVRESLRHVDTVIIDEIHAVAATKRGSHLAVSLERLEQICDRPPQRIGLSATQRPLSEIAHFLGGNHCDHSTGEVIGPRPVTIVDAGARKPLEIEVVVPIEDMALLGERVEQEDPAGGHRPSYRSIWPSMHPRLLELIHSHNSTIIFVNARRLSERLAARLNELASDGLQRGGENTATVPAESAELVRAHHGSLSRQQRLLLEDDLKAGRLKALVATSSLELGIDMGAVDLVIQVESPGSVSRGLQRVGRAGHQVGAPSRGRFFPKHRADLVETAVVVQRMAQGEIESTQYVRNPLDVAAQQIVASVALEELELAQLALILRGSAPFTTLSKQLFESVLDLLDGRYPSEEFSEFHPRVIWDRRAEKVVGRPGAQRIAVTNAGTIPDRGLFGVFLPDGSRVGELDEEMVYESRPGETFLLGASTWRIEEITHDRVIVTPAPGLPAKLPFWHGDGPGRPIELGTAVGRFLREIRALPQEKAITRLTEDHFLQPVAAQNLIAYLDDQAAATGSLPDDRTIVVERFRDEIGDWRICILTPFGARVHAPWALALRRRIEENGTDNLEILWTDDGIIFRLPDGVESFDVNDLLIDASEIDELVMAALPTSAMFASRFRESAARALLLPRRRVDQRSPLWQQRQRGATLLAAAAKYPEFPILLETTRECMNDVFDLPALRGLLEQMQRGAIRVVQADTQSASPFAASLLFSWVATYMYEGDAPLAERRATALALDRNLLKDLLGAEELRALLDAEVLEAVEQELQCLVPRRQANSVDRVHDLLRVLGPMNRDELLLRWSGVPEALNEALEQLLENRRAIEVSIGAERRFADAADAARLRDALGCPLPQGLPAAFTDSIDRPLEYLVGRYCQTHGPITCEELSRELALPREIAMAVLGSLAASGRVLRGEFRPTGNTEEWVDVEVLRLLRRRTLASLRHAVEPVGPADLATFLQHWQGLGSEKLTLVETLGQLQGAALVGSMLESDHLRPRCAEYDPSELDLLISQGEVLWVGAGGVGTTDGRVRLYFRADLKTLAEPPEPSTTPASPHHVAIRERLSHHGASFWADLVAGCSEAGLAYDNDTVLGALWDLVWSGEVTNDSLHPLRHRTMNASAPRVSTVVAKSGRARRGLRATVPLSAAGRWSLVWGTAPNVVAPEPTATASSSGSASAAGSSSSGSASATVKPLATVKSLARAEQLLARYGVLTREMALSEGMDAGFAGVYPVLKTLEERGTVRRGYFVAGLGAAQFALPAAVDDLRRANFDGAIILAADDPAQPYGAVLRWPESQGRPSRSVGARVVMVAGRPVAWLDRTGRSLVSFQTERTELEGSAPDSPAGAEVSPEQRDIEWLTTLAARVSAGELRFGKSRSLEITKVNGEPVRTSHLRGPLEQAGFVESYRGMVLRAPR